MATIAVYVVLGDHPDHPTGTCAVEPTQELAEAAVRAWTKRTGGKHKDLMYHSFRIERNLMYDSHLATPD